MPQIYTSFFEDDNENKHFFFTGKQEVLGISHPDYYAKNDNYKWVRVAFAVLPTSSELVYIHEKLTIGLVTFNTSNNTVTANNFNIIAQAYAYNKRIDRNSGMCLVSKNTDTTPPTVVLTEDNFSDDGVVRYGVGVWVKVNGAVHITTHVVESYSITKSPMDVTHFPTAYTTIYLDNQSISSYDSTTNNDDTINSKLIATGVYSQSNEDEGISVTSLEYIYDETYVQNTISFSQSYKPLDVNVDEIVTPTALTSASENAIYTVDAINKCIRVNRPGKYIIALKQGFILKSGSSTVNLSVYKNDDKIKELQIKKHLTVYPDTSTSLPYTGYLTTEDSIYLHASWDNKDIDIKDNDCMITIIYLGNA